MFTTTIRVAMGQMLVEGGQVDGNLDRAVGMIQHAASRGCDAIVLPECLDVGWTHPSARRLAEPVPGKTSKRLSQAAYEAGIHVIAGLTERAGIRTYNTGLLIDPGGQILLKHRKINVLDIAQDLYAVGNHLSVAEPSFGKVGVPICADNFSESLALGHALARMGAQVLLSPCAWAVDADYDHAREPYGAIWKEAYTTLARLYDVPVVGVSNVGRITGGPWEGRKCIGCSLAVGAGGEILVEAPYGETAECTTAVELTLAWHEVTGTRFAEMLRERGYHGP